MEIKPRWSLLKKLSQGFNLSGSLGYKITSLTLSIPRITVSSLSNPNPQPACGGIPQSNACKCSENFAGSRSCSLNLALIFSGLCVYYHQMTIQDNQIVNQMTRKSQECLPFP